jgi:meiotic recombination protein SPO11
VSNIASDALFILLVEKDAAFMRLAEDRFYNDYPSIIITAKGQPDVATRWVSLLAFCFLCAR